jgi:hypothetical protein
MEHVATSTVAMAGRNCSIIGGEFRLRTGVNMFVVAEVLAHRYLLVHAVGRSSSPSHLEGHAEEHHDNKQTSHFGGILGVALSFKMTISSDSCGTLHLRNRCAE